MFGEKGGKNCMYKKILAFALIILFILGSFAPIISSKINNQNINDKNLFTSSIDTSKETSSLTFYTFDKTGRKQNTVELSSNVANEINDLFENLKYKIVYEPKNIETQLLKNDFISLIDEYGLLSKKQSKEEVFSLLNPDWLKIDDNNSLKTKNPLTNKLFRPFLSSFIGTSVFCSISCGGSGMLMPLFMLPRPRAVAFWIASDAFTSVANLFTGKGFLAGGKQNGLLLGFMGIGLTYAIPGYTVYGFIGYSLFAGVAAEYIEFLPPNNAPVISNENPANNAVNVPIDLAELSFKIEDDDGDSMDYQVTTDPNIGSVTGLNVKKGIYNLSISGLESRSVYNWKVVVSDGKDTVEKTFSFTTVATEPIVSNPIPSDGQMEIPLSLSQLSFKLNDYQGDLMDYTVETLPNIGSGSGNNVVNGTYSISIDGLDYSSEYLWFVNVTDGANWAHEVFSFHTEFVIVFDPFEEGWQYRKQVVIDHDMVVGDLFDFPVLIRTVDSDLRDKAQVDGDDILFMDDSGVANKLYHEIENYDDSSGELVAWVKVSILNISQDTEFYMYYGNTNCSSQQFPEKVWNNHFSAVWHLNNNPTGSVFDSTVNNNDAVAYGSMSSSNLVEGKIGECLQFDGIDDYVGAPDNSSLCPINLTVSGWYKPLESGKSMYVISKASFDYWGNADGHTYGFHIYPDESLDATFERDDSQQYDTTENFSISLNQWYLLTLTYDETDNIGSLYVNGILQGEVGPCHPTVLWYYKPWDFIIGASRQSTGSSKIPNFFQNCTVDEVRVINTVKTSEWIATEYSNQNDPLNFLSFGLEESHP